jgi:hypothetical protein
MKDLTLNLINSDSLPLGLLMALASAAAANPAQAQQAPEAFSESPALPEVPKKAHGEAILRGRGFANALVPTPAPVESSPDQARAIAVHSALPPLAEFSAASEFEPEPPAPVEQQAVVQQAVVQQAVVQQALVQQALVQPDITQPLPPVAVKTLAQAALKPVPVPPKASQPPAEIPVPPPVKHFIKPSVKPSVKPSIKPFAAPAAPGAAASAENRGRTVAQTSDDAVNSKLQQLEQQQQQLKQEIEQLRQQLREAPTGGLAAAAEQSDPELTFAGSALFLKPSTSASMDFARVDPVAPGRIIGGPLAKVEFGRETAGRFALAYKPAGTAWEFGAAHTFLKGSDSESAVRPAGGFLYSTLSNPGGNDRAETADAKAKLAYNVTDLDLGYRLPLSKDFEVKLLTGLKVSNLEQSLTANYQGVSYAPDGGRVRQENDFNGLGPKLGLELRAKLGGGLSVFGRGGAALLLGKSTTGFQETFGTTELANLNLRRQTSIPAVEMALGVDWTANLSKSSKLNLSLGYEYQHWFNALNSVRFVDNSNPGLYTENRSDLSLQGFFAKLGVAFTF